MSRLRYKEQQREGLLLLLRFIGEVVMYIMSRS